MVLCLAGREIYTKWHQYINLPFVTKLSTRHVERPSTIWRIPRHQNHSQVYCSESGPRPDTALQSVVEDVKTISWWWRMSTRWHMMSKKQLSILIQGRNFARGNRQIIRIPRALACISAGAPWLWRSVMQIDKSFPRKRACSQHHFMELLFIGSSLWVSHVGPYWGGSLTISSSTRLELQMYSILPSCLETWRCLNDWLC